MVGFNMEPHSSDVVLEVCTGPHYTTSAYFSIWACLCSVPVRVLEMYATGCSSPFGILCRIIIVLRTHKDASADITVSLKYRVVSHQDLAEVQEFLDLLKCSLLAISPVFFELMRSQ